MDILSCPRWLNNPGMITVPTIENPTTDDVRGLIAELNAALLALTPPEFCFHMSAEDMAEDDTSVFVVRDGDEAVACGALKRHEADLAEIKRMYTKPSHQGQGIGGDILSSIETCARAEGVKKLVLETGDRHPAAWRVYERGGFTRCAPVLDYPDSKWSVFFQKNLTISSRETDDRSDNA